MSIRAMASNSKPMGSFVLTPHKVSLCILITVYAPPLQSAVPFPFCSIPQHNRLGLLLFSVTKGVCQLLTNIGTYCEVSNELHYELPDEDEFDNEPDLLNDDDLDLESHSSEKNKHEFEAGTSGDSPTFHMHAPRSLFGLVEDIQVSVNSKNKNDYDGALCSDFLSPSSDALRADDHQGGLFLCRNWQVQGYLRGQADLIEKHAISFPMIAFEATLTQLQKLAPELHRVHYLRYLNSLYHEDYFAALENLHCYFNYSTQKHCADTHLWMSKGLIRIFIN